MRIRVIGKDCYIHFDSKREKVFKNKKPMQNDIKVYICDKRNLTFKLKNRLNALPVEMRKTAEFYLVWNTFLDESETRINEAKEWGIKTVLLQHGRRALHAHTPPRNIKLNTDFIFIWGRRDYERLIKCGIPGEKLHITGCPFFEGLGKREKTDKVNILFEAMHWMPEVDENFLIMDRLVDLKDNYDCNIIAKIMHLNDRQRFEKYDVEVVYSDYKHEDHIRITIELIKKANVLISIAEGTMSLIAEALDIPVIVVTNVWEGKKFKNKGSIIKKNFNYSTGVYKTKLENLDKAIMKALNNDTKKDQRKRAAVNYGGLDLNFSDEVINFLENIRSNT